MNNATTLTIWICSLSELRELWHNSDTALFTNIYPAQISATALLLLFPFEFATGSSVNAYRIYIKCFSTQISVWSHWISVFSYSYLATLLQTFTHFWRNNSESTTSCLFSCQSRKEKFSQSNYQYLCAAVRNITTQPPFCSPEHRSKALGGMSKNTR